MKSPNELSAHEAAAQIESGSLTSEALIASCLDRISERDDVVKAWIALDRDKALAQARERDREPRRGPLHGVPFAVKDIIDTASLPTGYGSPIYDGHQPDIDAACVALTKSNGGVMLGKTVSTEFASRFAGATTNPHNPAHTPGGSSSGSAAAVAAHMVPLAIGTQTNGSVIRPASFCGIVGFKTSHGLIPRTGVLTQSPPLDTVGTCARTVEDVALLTEALIAYDPGDKDTRARARPPLSRTAAEEPPMTPLIAFAKTTVWDQADRETQAAFGELADLLGDDCSDLPLSAAFDHAVEMHRNIMTADLAKSFAGYYERGKDKLSDTLCEMIEFGQKVSAVDYNKALEYRELLNSGLDSVFDDFDIILTPATTGEAPAGLDATGNPVFNTLWTLCGTPSIALPLMQGPSGLPIGVQVVGPRGDDARLLRNANWLMQRIMGNS